MSLQPHFGVYYRYDIREKPKVDELGLNFDEKIKTWKQSLEHRNKVLSIATTLSQLLDSSRVSIKQSLFQ